MLSRISKIWSDYQVERKTLGQPHVSRQAAVSFDGERFSSRRFLVSYRAKVVGFRFLSDECAFTQIACFGSNRRLRLKLFGAFLRERSVQVFGLDVEQAGTGRHSVGWDHGRNFGVLDGMMNWAKVQMHERMKKNADCVSRSLMRIERQKRCHVHLGTVSVYVPTSVSGSRCEPGGGDVE